MAMIVVKSLITKVGAERELLFYEPAPGFYDNKDMKPVSQ
jgi:hypothetical protein